MTSVITASLPRFQTPTDVLLRDVSGASRSWTTSAWVTGIVAFHAPGLAIGSPSASAAPSSRLS